MAVALPLLSPCVISPFIVVTGLCEKDYCVTCLDCILMSSNKLNIFSQCLLVIYICYESSCYLLIQAHIGLSVLFFFFGLEHIVRYRY